MLDVLVDGLKALSLGEVEHNHSALAAPEVLPRECEEGLLAGRVPDLQPDGCLVHLKRDRLELDANSGKRPVVAIDVVDESDEEARLAAARGA